MKALMLEATVDPRARPEAPANHRLRDPKIVYRNLAEPTVAEDDDVLIEVYVNGICGSDIHVTEQDEKGWVKFSGPATAPVILGHEFVGCVVRIGKAVRKVRVGDLVACESIQACGQCKLCVGGHYNQCLHVELLGLTRNGGLASFVIGKERHVHNIDRIVGRYGIDRGVDLAACLEPIGCSFCGMFVERSGGINIDVQPGETAAVFGCGPIGLGAIALLRTFQIERILAFDVNSQRLELAKKIGASDTFLTDKEHPAHIAENVRELTAGLGPDLIVEAAGDPDLFATLVDLAAPRGRIVYLGRTPRVVSLDTNVIVSKAIEIKPSRGHAGYGIFPTLIDLIATERLDLSNFITSHFSFDNAISAFDRAREQKGGKILIDVAKERYL